MAHGPGHIAIIGVGLLGGSVGLAAKAADERVRVTGIGRREASLRQALEAGAIDVGTLDVAQGVAEADLVVLASPLEAYREQLAALRPALRRGATVTDVGSTKAQVVRLAERVLGAGGPFVDSHPMAGSERRGVEFARADLFRNATCIVTPTPRTPPARVRLVERFWQSLGAVTVRLSPAEHDRAVARASHLPHVLAAALVRLQHDDELDLAGGGLLDTTRVASGDPAMWREILLTNRSAVLSGLARTGREIDHLAKLLERGDARRLEEYLAQAKSRRDAIIARRMRRGE